MSASLNLLQAYGNESDSDDECKKTESSKKQQETKPDDGQEFKFAKIEPSLSIKSSITVDLAPYVPYSVQKKKKRDS